MTLHPDTKLTDSLERELIEQALDEERQGPSCGQLLRGLAVRLQLVVGAVLDARRAVREQSLTEGV